MPSIDMSNKRKMKALNIAKRGISRFYSEGFTRWSMEDFQAALKNQVPIDDPVVQSALREWDQNGYVDFIGNADEYFIVLRPFPNDSL